MSATVAVFGCASPRSHGRDQLRRLSEQARRRGARLVGADTPDNLRVMVRPELVDELVALDVHDPATARQWAAGRPGVDAVLTFREMSVEATAAAAEELGLAGITPAAARTVRNKDLCRQALRAAGFRQPDGVLAGDEDEARRFLQRTAPGPWIVKPRDSVGSIGVSLVDRPQALRAAIGRLEPGVPFLVETYVDGPEFSAEGVLLGGVPVVLALSAKTTDSDFMAVRHRVPAGPDAGLDAATAAAATADVERALRLVGVTRGVFHVEFWVDGGQVVLGEMHARPGGEFLHAMVEHCRPGLELYGMLIDDLLGEPAAPIPELSAAAGSEFLSLPAGEVLAVHGWPQVLADPQLIAADLLVRPGDRIERVPGGANRHGVLVAGAPSPPDVEAVLRRLCDTVRVDVS